MNGVENIDIRLRSGDLRQGMADIFEPLAEIFPAMTGHQDETAAGFRCLVVGYNIFKSRKALDQSGGEAFAEVAVSDFFDNHEQSVDDGVDGDVYAFFFDPLGQEILFAELTFIVYFNKTMAKPFKWTYKGRPLVC